MKVLNCDGDDGLGCLVVANELYYLFRRCWFAVGTSFIFWQVVDYEVSDRVVDYDAVFVEALMDLLYELAFELERSGAVGGLYEDPEVDIGVSEDAESGSRFGFGDGVFRFDDDLSGDFHEDIFDLL